MVALQTSALNEATEALKHDTAQPHPDITATPGWLTPFAQGNDGRQVVELEHRLQGDADLVYRLMFAGYQGPEWNEVAHRLAAYGLRVLTAWILDGSIRNKCAEKNRPGPWSSRLRDLEVARDLATDTVTVALVKFRDEVLIPGRWHPNGGASLSTYFIGQCLLRWANVYRNWQRQQRNQLPLAPTSTTENDRPGEDSAGRALDRVEIDHTLASADPLVVRTIQFRTAGFSWEEISLLTNQPIPTLRGRLHRFQRLARDRRKAS